MYVIVGTKIALATKSRVPEEEFYYWIDSQENFFVDNDNAYFIHELETEVTT